MADPEMVYIAHDGTEAVGYVVRSAFEGEHKAKGWKEVAETDVEFVTDDTGQTRLFKAKSKAAAAAKREA